jgi:hypothetical protein
VKLSASILILYATLSTGVQDTYEDLFRRRLELAGEGRDIDPIRAFRTAVERYRKLTQQQEVGR